MIRLVTLPKTHSKRAAKTEMKEIIIFIAGAVVTKITEFAMEALRRRRETSRKPFIARLDEVTDWRWSGESLLKKLINLDRRDYGRPISDLMEGTPAQWAPVFTKCPETWALLCVGTNKIIGYWHLLALDDATYERALNGELLEGSITVDHAVSVSFPGVYNGYFSHIGVSREYRAYKRTLLKSLYENLEALASEGVFFREICANAYSEEGEEMCAALMNKVCDHSVEGQIFRLSLFPWPAHLRHRRWRLLHSLYDAQYEKLSKANQL